MSVLPVLKDSKQNSSKLSSSAFVLRWHMRHKIHNQTPNDVIMDHFFVCFCQKFSQSDKKSCRIADNFFIFGLGWFSVGIYKYKPGYKSHDLFKIQCSHWLNYSIQRENLVKDFFCKTKFSTNQSTRIYVMSCDL